MQIVPATGRRYARTLRIPRFSAAMLTDPEINVRIGTAYFADLVERFGGVHHALASYNAGPSPVSRWIAEKPGIARDEFIDDIPYPETQNYVKRILGTAEDYRRLYSERRRCAPVARCARRPRRRAAAAPAKKASAGRLAAEEDSDARTKQPTSPIDQALEFADHSSSLELAADGARRDAGPIAKSESAHLRSRASA